jgi:glycerophosphoryl diester phosphodiesterase
MNTRLLIAVVLVVLAITAVTHYLSNRFQGQPELIAHAGGGIDGEDYMNSLEAINLNYALGHRYFEIDFSWTADDELVLIHDWKKSYKRLFKNHSEQAPTAEQFLNMPMFMGHTPMSLKDLISWLKKHPDAHVLADIKDRNLDGLHLIKRLYPEANQQFVAQVFHPREYPEVRAMGFDRVVYSLYKIRIPTVEIKTFIKEAELFGLAMKAPHKQQDFEALLQTANDHRIFVYVQTVNDMDQWLTLKAQGVNGIYTDDLYHQDGHLLSQEH